MARRTFPRSQVRHEAKAASVLRRNLLIYGVGGILVPFPGIKLIDMIVRAIGFA